MSHDFARSHRLKKESARKPARKKSGGVPSWLWLLVGTLVGCLIMFLVYLSGVAPPRPGLQPIQPGVQGAADNTSKAAEPPSPPKRVSPVFEFYTKLPGGGQPVTDIAPATGNVPATGVSPAPAANPAPATAAAPAAGPAAQPVDPIQQLLAEKEAARKQGNAEAVAAVAKPEPAKPEPKADQAKTDQTKAAARAEPAKPAGGGQYLQAGVFRNKAEVDKLKARIALMGYKPVVQPLQNAKGETLHKVLVGPFRSPGDMDDARIILGGNGVNAIPVK